MDAARKLVPQHTIAILAFLLACIFYSSPKVIIADADFGWHLATGDLIRALNAIPRVDTFSYTAGDNAWYNFSWLSDVLFSLLYQLGGMHLLNLMIIITYAFIISVLAKRCYNSGAGFIATALVTIIATIIMFNTVTVRPQVFTFLLALWYHGNLSGMRDSGSTASFKQPLLLAALMTFWVNLHGGFVIGLFMIGAFFLEAIASKNYAHARTFFLTGLLCLAATLVNPYGYNIYLAHYIFMTGSIMPYVTEWDPFIFIHHHDASMALIFTLVFARFFSKNIPLADKIMAFCWLLLSLKSVRYFEVFITLSAPFLAVSMRESMAGAKSSFSFQKQNDDFERIINTKSTRNKALLAACLYTIILATPQFHFFLRGEDAGFDSKYHPVTEFEFVLQNYPDLRFFNDYNYSGYITHRSNGNFKVFIDGRANVLYPFDLINDYLDAVYIQTPEWERILDKYKIDGVILAKSYPLTAYLGKSPNWRIVFEGKSGVVFVRSTL